MAGSLMRFLRRMRHFKKGKLSFSQSGEDVIVDSLFTALGLRELNYLDIGSHDPVKLSNTYYFYLKGGSGVLVEPDPNLFPRLQRARRRDTCLNAAVSIDGTRGRRPFYLMRSSTLNTFSKAEAMRCAAMGEPILREIEVDTLPVSVVLEEHFASRPLHFLSLDVEGVDLDIIRSIDFARWRPWVMCVETITFDADRQRQRKRSEIIEHLTAQDYLVYADTYINTVFVDRRIWHSAPASR
ncbi:MAG TPA: FkbM family methyltransferase [Verrucomicrobiae bacterium]|nr:FkbM family methyltransferase [Verrucomicrobiae bacterium]